MSSTNKTATLNLTQYIGTDIINYISDYNDDMLKIDNFAAQKGVNGGLASLTVGGKLAQMPTASDVGAASETDERFIPTGTVVPFSAETIPQGYLLCQGQAVSRETYAALYAIIGTTYGAGNGSTTFNLPDLKSRIPVGMQTGDEYFGTLGKADGSTQQDLSSGFGNFNGDINRVAFATNPSPVGLLACNRHSLPLEKFENIQLDTATKVLQTNGKQATTVQPYVTMNYIIKY